MSHPATPSSLEPSRRRFLRWASALGAFFTTGMVGIPSLRSFLSPAFRQPQGARWIPLGEAEQIEAGVPTRFDFAENVSDAWVETRALRGVWIYTEDNQTFTVYNGHCPHLACSYGFDQERNVFHCPCHHGLFNLKTGAVLGGPPPRSLDVLETKVEGGILYVSYREFRAGIADKIATTA